MRNISILGSTGSIGTQTLDVVTRMPGEFKVVGLATANDLELLETQIRQFKPDIVSVANEELANRLYRKVKELQVEVTWGLEGLTKIATITKADMIVTAVSGAVGLIPTIEALKCGKTIAFANKETLVAAGEIVTNLTRRGQGKLIPVDSEHSAIFQCLQGEQRKAISKLIITASGGPFRTWSSAELATVTAAQALKHPKWKMGPKITVDSATLMNKGLEVIEARWLFDIPYPQISVIVHPQSTIHSMVEFHDGAIIAQLGIPDMRIPIQYALTYPNRAENDLPRLNLLEVAQLSFEAPDLVKFPCLQMAFDAGQEGGTMPAVMNAANEVAVAAFLQGDIQFTKIPQIIAAVMDAHHNNMIPELPVILEADRWARAKALSLC